MAIQTFFTAAGQKKALEAYSNFARGSDWSVIHKLDLYRLAGSAFEPDVAPQQALEPFTALYKALASHWQVFRPHSPAECWSAEQVYTALGTHLRDYGPRSGVTLMDLGGKENDLMFSLQGMEGIKPNQWYPVMTVSKFAHFYNPKLFPIYDTEVVENRVFKCFRKDYRQFCTSRGYDASDSGAQFLRNYVAWASECVRGAHDQYMNTFADWILDELPRREAERLDPQNVCSLYATAFEFNAIGAAVVSGY
jgi:hypothetical protein